jgi:crotonobetainyl-CoA:carnitine CoA-transferase CaiB-like acyl-CoA transferase
MPFQPASSALQRFTVLDLTRVRSGPTAVRQLADWGANVIKIELPEGASELAIGDALEAHRLLQSDRIQHRGVLDRLECRPRYLAFRRLLAGGPKRGRAQ